MSLSFGIVLAWKLDLFLTRSLQLASRTNDSNELHARGRAANVPRDDCTWVMLSRNFDYDVENH
jgi:hypothetical protein